MKKLIFFLIFFFASCSHFHQIEQPVRVKYYIPPPHYYVPFYPYYYRWNWYYAYPRYYILPKEAPLKKYNRNGNRVPKP